MPPAARGVLTSVVLAVAHRPDGPARTGTLLTCTLRVTNTGNVDLHAAVTTTMPYGAEPGPARTWPVYVYIPRLIYLPLVYAK